LKIPSEFLSIKFLAHQNQIGFLRFVVLARGVEFEDPPCKNTLCWAWAALGRVGAMQLPYWVDWLGWWLFADGGYRWEKLYMFCIFLEK
jgi:hypothetical protein